MRGVPAKFWKRVVAYIADSLIISFIILSPFSSVMNNSFDTSSFTSILLSLQSTFTKEFFLISITLAILTLIYWTFMEWKYQQSIGKILLGLVVVSTTKKRLSFNQALTRNITKLSTIILILDCINIFRNKKKNQRFFERFSKTQVMEGILIK
jgi:uncharacterized RDD family membrane protein YckC